MKSSIAIACAAIGLLLVPPVAQADSISGIEGARAKERQGRYLNRQDREQLRRYGGNDDYGPRYAYPRSGYYGGYRDYYSAGPGYGYYIDRNDYRD